MLRAILFFLPLTALASGDFVFTFFRGNGETGVYLAHSQDGYRWEALNGDQPVIRPGQAGMLMRDPFLVKGPDETWHLLWTTGWTRGKNGGLTIGHATSKDLAHWGEQQLIDIPLEGARNAWAPEMAWDGKRKAWIIFWASTIPGRFPQTEQTGDNGYNHRLWSMTTADFRSFSTPELYFDPGFNSIDSTVARVGKRWIMVFKDERKNPLQKRLRLAFANGPAGPWTGVTEPFTIDWVEGPSALQIGGEWLIYFDHYSKPQYYGAYRTRDWKTFEDVSKQLSLPAEPRHGTAAKVTRKEAERLKSMR